MLRMDARGPLTFSRQRQWIMGLRHGPGVIVPAHPCKSVSARLHPGWNGRTQFRLDCGGEDNFGVGGKRARLWRRVTVAI